MNEPRHFHTSCGSPSTPPRALLQRSEHHPCSSPALVAEPPTAQRWHSCAVPVGGRGGEEQLEGWKSCLCCSGETPRAPRDTHPALMCRRFGGCSVPSATARPPKVNIGSVVATARYWFSSGMRNKLEVLKSSSNSN